MKQNESMQQVIEAIHRLNQAAAMPAAGADIWQMVLKLARSNDADHERLMGLLESVLTSKREAAAVIRAELERELEYWQQEGGEIDSERWVMAFNLVVEALLLARECDALALGIDLSEVQNE